MNTRIVDQWLDMNRAAMAPLMRWNEIAAEAMDKVARQNLTLAQDYVELGARQLQLMGEVKDPQKWALEESKVVSEFGQKIVGRVGDYFRVAKETQEAMATWADTTVKAAVESVAPKAQ